MKSKSTLAHLLDTKELILDRKAIFNAELGREISWMLVRVDLDLLRPNGMNNRFAPDSPMNDAEHEKAIEVEDPAAYENLVKSVSSNPQFEQLIGHISHGGEHIEIIAGHRRYFAIKKTGQKDLLIWVAFDLSETERELIRDWPEIHPTKVKHSNFARIKAIFMHLEGTSGEERERRVRSWERKGYSQKAVEKYFATYERLKDFAETRGQKAEDRASQVKSFESYNQLCETTFRKLQDEGDFTRICALDKLATSYLDNGIAHDDFKITIDEFSKLSSTDPVWKSITSNTELADEDLRRFTILARSLKSDQNILREVQDFSCRLFAKLIDRADSHEIHACIREIEDLLDRLKITMNTILDGGKK